MSDDGSGRSRSRSRALVTDSELERISGEADVEAQRRYEAVSRVRKRIRDELPGEMDVLREHHPDLLEELVDAVCGDLAVREADGMDAARNPRVLAALHWGDRLDLDEMADRLDEPETTIRSHMVQNDIPIRGRDVATDGGTRQATLLSDF